MLQEIGGDGASFDIGGGKVEVVLSKATQGDSDVGEVVGGVGVEDDDVAEVRGDAFQTFDDFVDDFNKPAGGSAVALGRHHKPL